MALILSDSLPKGGAFAPYKVLAEFGAFALGCANRAALMEEAARQVSAMLRADRCLVAAISADTGDMRVEAARGWPDDIIGRPLAADRPADALAVPIPSADGPVGTIELAGGGAGALDGAADLLAALAAILGASLARLTAEEARSRALARRQEEERRYLTMAELIPQIVWTAGPDGRVDYYNRRWTDYTGLSVDTGTAGDWPAVVHPDDQDRTLSAWASSVATGRVYEIEHRVRRADGGWRWMLSRAWPLRDEDGRIVRWFGTATDIDAEHNARQNMTQARDAAERANRAKSRFLAAASHDLRQPLNAFGLLVGTLRARLSEPRNVTVVEQLEDSLEAMIELFEGLMDLSKLESEAVHVDVRPVGLPALFAKLERDLGPTAEAKGLELRMRPLDVRALTDATLLERILRNLIGNAVRYTRKGGVLVGMRRRAGRLRIDVVDTGPGIAEEHLEEIFQEFQQLGNPARERGSGHGIGLAIVRRAAEILGHPVTVCSRPGIGSRFSIELPVTIAADTGVALPASRGCTPQPRQTLSVLLLEDDPLVLTATRMLLESIGCKVQAARTAAEALHKVTQGLKPDLVLADYRLPGGVDGLTAVERLRAALSPALPAVLITGDVTDELAPLARSARIEVLRKPVKPEELQRLIERARGG